MKKGQGTVKGWKVLNRDRSFNVASPPGIQAADLYHSLLATTWCRFLIWVSVLYVGVNILFAQAYYLGGPNVLEGIPPEARHRWLDCFFFSVQTMATIGYGKISPLSLWAHCLVTLEALIGILGIAVASGLFFARFSRPTARVAFSKVALVTQHESKPTLMLRMANQRSNQIVEAQISLTLMKSEINAEGVKYRKLYDLALTRSRTPLFSLTWTILHVLTPESPLYGRSLEDLRKDEVEIFVTMTGIDGTFSHTIHDRFSYGPDDIVWNGRFVDMLGRTEDGKLTIAFENLDKFIPASA